MSEIAAQQVITTPIGKVAIAATDQGLVQVEILTDQPKSTFTNSSQAAAHCRAAAKQLLEYFEGKRDSFELSYQLGGTEFQVAIWREIAKVPFGSTVSYQQLAARVGKPLAARAVGGAVGANPLPILIGCHRVLGSGGKITGYSGGEGLKTKRWLLGHEGIRFSDA